MVVKHINGQPIMLASYWDVGYIKVNVSDPENPVIIGDSAFGDEDPVMKIPGTDEGWEPPEGNGHQGEFSHDNKYVLAADEDFDQYRLLGEIDKGAGDIFRFFSARRADRGPADHDRQLDRRRHALRRRRLRRGDHPARHARASTSRSIERGGCNFQVKVQNAEARGYDGVIIFNSNNAASTPCEGLLNMTFTNYTGDATAIFVPREVGMQIIGAWTPGYTCAQAAPAASAARAIPVLDRRRLRRLGLHAPLRQLGQRPRGGRSLRDRGGARTSATRIGFGDLTVHEFATDPTENLAYSSYYAGGLRVMSFGREGLEEVGKFIDKGGNNFWGVEVFDDPDDGRLIASPTATSACTCSGTRASQAPAPTPPVCGDASAVTPAPRPSTCTLSLQRHQRQRADVLGRRPAGQRHARRAAAARSATPRTPASRGRTRSRSRPTTARATPAPATATSRSARPRRRADGVPQPTASPRRRRRRRRRAPAPTTSLAPRRVTC